VKKQRLMVGLWLFVGLLWVIAGLRDVLAPGFFSMSPHIPSRTDIIVKFSLAAVFFALAFLTSRTHQPDGRVKKLASVNLTS